MLCSILTFALITATKWQIMDQCYWWKKPLPATHPVTLIVPIFSVLQWQQLKTIDNTPLPQFFLISIVETDFYQHHSAVDSAPLSTPSFVNKFQYGIPFRQPPHNIPIFCTEPFSVQAPVVHAWTCLRQLVTIRLWCKLVLDNLCCKTLDTSLVWCCW